MNLLKTLQFVKVMIDERDAINIELGEELHLFEVMNGDEVDKKKDIDEVVDFF